MVCVSIPCSEVCILKPQMIIRPKLMLFFIVSLKTSVQMTSCKQFQGDICFCQIHFLLHQLLPSFTSYTGQFNKNHQKNITSQIRINKSTTTSRQTERMLFYYKFRKYVFIITMNGIYQRTIVNQNVLSTKQVLYTKDGAVLAENQPTVDKTGTDNTLQF